jgi:hypothetical protein
MGYKSPYDKVGKVMPEMKHQSKSSLMMKDASPLGFHKGEKHETSTEIPASTTALERAKRQAAQLQLKKTADSLNYVKDLEKQFRNERGQLDAKGDRQLMKDVKERASKVFDFDIIEPTEKFPQTGVNVNKGLYLGSGYITDGKEQGFDSGMSVTELAKDKPRSGFEQLKAKKISELLGLN